MRLRGLCCVVVCIVCDAPLPVRGVVVVRCVGTPSQLRAQDAARRSHQAQMRTASVSGHGQSSQQEQQQQQQQYRRKTPPARPRSAVDVVTALPAATAATTTRATSVRASSVRTEPTTPPHHDPVPGAWAVRCLLCAACWFVLFFWKPQCAHLHDLCRGDGGRGGGYVAGLAVLLQSDTQSVSTFRSPAHMPGAITEDEAGDSAYEFTDGMAGLGGAGTQGDTSVAGVDADDVYAAQADVLSGFAATQE